MELQYFKRACCRQHLSERMSRILVPLLLLFLSFSTTAQTLLQGVVKDAATGKPLPAASVFLNNTSFGTRTDDEGKFALQIPAGRFDLVVSSIGYQTFSQSISGAQAAVNISLSPKAAELETVVVEAYEKDGWKKWGRFFLENFIGTSDLASECVIRNPEVLRFRNSKKTKTLQAIALEPLIIENKALGYRLHYQLETFSYQFDTRYLVFTGYPFFEPMKGSRSRERRWEKARQETYLGSLMHFMRSLYRNQISEEGFEVRKLEKVVNAEKKRVKQAAAANRKTVTNSRGALVMTYINEDSAQYYSRVLQQEDVQDVVGRNILPGDSIAYAITETAAGLEFPDYLLVIYKKKMAPLAYTSRFPKSSTAMMSQLTLVNGNPVEIHANGSYYNPEDLLSLGFWAWFEKIATMLPFNYTPTAP